MVMLSSWKQWKRKDEEPRLDIGSTRHQVQRSVSLQQRSDRNNNNSSKIGRNGQLGGNDVFNSCGRLELANLLARAADYDAKLQLDIGDGDSLDIDTNVDPVQNGFSSNGPYSPSDHPIAQLPLRYRETSSMNISDPSKTSFSKRWRDTSIEEREKDAREALLWIRQEIRALKRKDKALMRQLLEIGRSIHQMSGHLETISCQTVTERNIADDIIAEDDSVLPSPLPQQPEDIGEEHLDSQFRAVSMVTVSQRHQTPPAPPGKKPSSRARHWLMSKFHRSSDQMPD